MTPRERLAIEALEAALPDTFAPVHAPPRFVRCRSCRFGWTKGELEQHGQRCLRPKILQALAELRKPEPATSEYLRGANEMLDRVRGSLREYPHMGGDINVMTEVDRLRKDAKLEGAKDLAERLKVDYMRTTESINRWIDAALAEMEASHGRAPEGLTPGGLRGHVYFECETREDYKDDE